MSARNRYSYRGVGDASQNHTLPCLPWCLWSPGCKLRPTSASSVTTQSEAGLIATAREGVRRTMGIDTEPDVTFVQRWERGIPNYAVGHLQAMEELFSRVKHHPQLYLNCNAYHGIAMNDCVRNSRELAERMCDG